MRAVVPNALTATRIPIAAAAIVAAVDNQLVLAAVAIGPSGRRRVDPHDVEVQRCENIDDR